MGGTSRYVNAELIETIEMVPDTVIILTNGHRYLIREPSDTILARIIAFKHRCINMRDRTQAAS